MVAFEVIWAPVPQRFAVACVVDTVWFAAFKTLIVMVNGVLSGMGKGAVGAPLGELEVTPQEPVPSAKLTGPNN